MVTRLLRGKSKCVLRNKRKCVLRTGYGKGSRLRMPGWKGQRTEESAHRDRDLVGAITTLVHRDVVPRAAV